APRADPGLIPVLPHALAKQRHRESRRRDESERRCEGAGLNETALEQAEHGDGEDLARLVERGILDVPDHGRRVALRLRVVELLQQLRTRGEVEGPVLLLGEERPTERRDIDLDVEEAAADGEGLPEPIQIVPVLGGAERLVEHTEPVHSIGILCRGYQPRICATSSSLILPRSTSVSASSRIASARSSCASVITSGGTMRRTLPRRNVMSRPSCQLRQHTFAVSRYAGARLARSVTSSAPTINPRPRMSPMSS